MTQQSISQVVAQDLEIGDEIISGTGRNVAVVDGVTVTEECVHVLLVFCNGNEADVKYSHYDMIELV